MSFAYPWALLALLVPVVLAWWWRGSDRRVALPFDHGAPRRHRLASALLAIAHAAPLVALAAAILLLAAPSVKREATAKRKLTNIQIVLDVSGSMSSQYENPPRYSYARAAIESFTKAREGDAMGLIVFGTEAVRWIPLTTDLAALRHALTFIDPDKGAAGIESGTHIGGALRLAARALEVDVDPGDDGDRVIILVSDGDSQDLEGNEHLAVAHALLDVGTKVFYLHIGSDPLASEVIEIATLTGGRSFEALDRASTLAVFDTLDAMTRASFVSEVPERREAFRPFAIVLLGACALHLIGLLGLRYTPW